MLKETHLRIARRIGQELNMKESTISALKRGSVAPDVWRNYPHHRKTGRKDKVQEIKNGIINARKSLLNGENLSSAEKLGEIFHYIADRCTSGPSSSEGRLHTAYEQKIGSCKLSGKPMGLTGRDETVQYACNFSNDGNPQGDLSAALGICLSVARSVFGRKTPPPKIREKIDKAGERVARTISVYKWALILAGFYVILCTLVNVVVAGALLPFLFMAITQLAVLIFVGGETNFERVEKASNAVGWVIWSSILFLGYLLSGNLLLCLSLPGLGVQIALAFKLELDLGSERLKPHIEWYSNPEKEITGIKGGDERKSGGKMIQQKSKKPKLSTVIFLMLAVFSLFYGSTWAMQAGLLFGVFCLWVIWYSATHPPEEKKRRGITHCVVCGKRLSTEEMRGHRDFCDNCWFEDLGTAMIYDQPDEEI